MCEEIRPTIVADETLSGACVPGGSARSNDQHLVLGYRRQNVTCSGPIPSVFASVGPKPAPDEASRRARFGTSEAPEIHGDSRHGFIVAGTNSGQPPVSKPG